MKQKTLLGAGGLLSLLIIWQLSSYWLSQRISLASTLAPLPTLDSFIWLIISRIYSLAYNAFSSD